MLDKFSKKDPGLDSLLPYVGLVEEGKMLLKTGAMCATYEIRGKDVSSCSDSEIGLMSVKVSEQLKELGDGWMIHVDTIRNIATYYPSESENRLLKRFKAAVGNQLPFVLEQDRYFDMVSARDFVRVIEAVIDGTVQDRDLNIVYDQKYRLSDILMLYSKLHGIDTIFLHVQSSVILNYTGNSDRLARYNLNLDNLEKSLLLYGK